MTRQAKAADGNVPHLFSFPKRLEPSRRTACEDIVQNIFLKLWNDRKSLVIENSLKSYLLKAVRNYCLDELRHRRIIDEHIAYELKSDSIDIDTTENKEGEFLTFVVISGKSTIISAPRRMTSIPLSGEVDLIKVWSVTFTSIGVQ